MSRVQGMPDIGFMEAGRGVMNAVHLAVALAAVTSAAGKRGSHGCGEYSCGGQ